MVLGVIDIGGTSIKYGVLSETGELIHHDSAPTEAWRGGNAVVEKVCKISDALRGRFTIEGIAISSAGQINNRNGSVVFATDNIPGYTGTPVAERISRHTGLPVTVENDVNCTALGEHWKGAGRGVRNFVCMTIGTGIGGALFLDGRLYTGSAYSAGEIGHISLYPGGKPCTCGNRGCYEQYASASALIGLIRDAYGGKPDLEAFFRLVKDGEKKALEIFGRWVDDIATGLQSLVHVFNPECIIIGGGVSEQGEMLRRAIENALREKVMPNHRQALEVRLAEQGNRANLLGAAHHFMVSRKN
ncbi:ROK family protein [Bhargavaea beijingensis]|uniref:ROK family protein n=1 Tax=Bhargavaea beijingensis TaxID=426756 RepID=A0A1G7A0W8_9BACL|nr:ROK family protein [Bhargavaea beijingensis]MCW1927243.1 ROK family protein [Bhargavaea beijingensis]RSK35623.1 ROK family protein [Bhargavaea beijingensis]SDE08273.1 ROK family protein (putative glucokinase) [Bhargavaea beijingensis]